LNLKDTLLATTTDISRRNIAQTAFYATAAERETHSFRHLSKSKISCLGPKSLKQAYSPIEIPSPESRVKKAIIFTDLGLTDLKRSTGAVGIGGPTLGLWQGQLS
jgi:hypothetical protein